MSWRHGKAKDGSKRGGVGGVCCFPCFGDNYRLTLKKHYQIMGFNNKNVLLHFVSLSPNKNFHPNIIFGAPLNKELLYSTVLQ